MKSLIIVKTMCGTSPSAFYQQGNSKINVIPVTGLAEPFPILLLNESIVTTVR